jgi:hypothetical protein
VTRLLAAIAAAAASLTAPLAAQDEAEANYFGKQDKTRSGLIAIIYDLKQTQSRTPSGVGADRYPAVIREFLEKGWDELVLNRFFRVTRPLYATQIFIPRIDAGAAPKAFGVQDLIQPSEWVVHYKGQVSPPSTGRYRFVGYADDIMAVAVNGKTVMIGGRPDMRLDEVWDTDRPHGANAFNGSLVYGDWIDMEKGSPIDLDVLVGERPGGDFGAYLLYQMEGETYPKTDAGHPILPVFQLAKEPLPKADSWRVPPFSQAAETWQQTR